ncbi:MAG: GatB/YqeY domain-containing protein [Deferribacteraceae bacterium]|jgi:uncharacterized protein YqeY|nr:GatB/YqeY domain-containing protein [Deferribacteraceae bacterium]
MPLKVDINEDLKSFMRAKDAYALEIIRLLKADIKNTEIAQKGELDDAGILKCVKTLIKKHTEALDIFSKAGRGDLVEKEKKYLEILAKYMPKTPDEAELNRYIAQAAAEYSTEDSKKSFGLIMKAVMAKAGPAADGKVVSALIKRALEGQS